MREAVIDVDKFLTDALKVWVIFRKIKLISSEADKKLFTGKPIKYEDDSKSFFYFL